MKHKLLIISTLSIVCAAAAISIICFAVKKNRMEHSGTAETLYVKAVDQYQIQNLDEALSLARQCESIDADFYQAHFLESKILFFMNDYSHSYDILCNLVKTYRSYTEARIWRIRVAILLGKYEEAKSFLEEELSFNSTDWRVYYLYSLLAKKNEQFDMQLSFLRDAESVLCDAAKVYSDEAATWSALGVENKFQTYVTKAKAIGGKE